MKQWHPAGIVTFPYPSRTPDCIVEAHTEIILSVNELLARYNFLLLLSQSSFISNESGAKDIKDDRTVEYIQ